MTFNSYLTVACWEAPSHPHCSSCLYSGPPSQANLKFQVFWTRSLQRLLVFLSKCPRPPQPFHRQRTLTRSIGSPNQTVPLFLGLGFRTLRCAFCCLGTPSKVFCCCLGHRTPSLMRRDAVGCASSTLWPHSSVISPPLL